MDRRVTPPQRVTSPTWGPPPPCKQGLRFDQISPRSRKISQSSWRDLFYLAQMSFISARSRRHLREITNLPDFLARSRLSRRNLFHIGEISFVSQKYLSSRASLGEISSVSRPRSLSSRADLRDITNLAEFLTRSRRDLIYLAATLETLQISPRYWRDLVCLLAISETLQISPSSLISKRSLSSRRDLVAISETLQISPRSRRD